MTLSHRRFHGRHHLSPITADELERLTQLRQYATDWCNKHQWQVGVAEMALGAALIAAGWQNGAIQMGVDFVVHKLSPGWAAEIAGGASGLLGLATYFVGSIGVAVTGGAFCVPALALAGGAALVLGLAGYGAATLVEAFLHQAPGLGDFATAGGLVTVGAWLLVDGACRMPLARKVATKAKEAGLELVRVARALVVDSASAFATQMRDEVAPFLAGLTNVSAVRSAVLTGAGAAAVGAAVAPTFVTVMGSSTLGTVAVSLGLVSAPVWPIIAGAGVGLLAGYGLWRLFAGDDESFESSPPTLPRPDTPS